MSQPDDAALAARRLMGRPAARELVPETPGLSARWHIHDYPGPYCRWNYHPEHEVHLIQHGTGRYVVGDRISTFGPGQLVLVGSNLPHHWISDLEPGARIAERDVVFQFHPRWLADCQRLMPELTAVDPLLHRAARGLEFGQPVAAAAARQLVAIGAADGLERLGLILGLLDTLVRAENSQVRVLASPWAPRAADSGAADVVDDALGYIASAAGRPVTMAEAARRAGMSTSGFSRYFSRAAGQSFSDTVRKMRMAQACQLLEQTDVPVAAVAQRIGYQNLSNFNRQFRSQHGVTPTAYRRRASQPDAVG